MTSLSVKTYVYKFKNTRDLHNQKVGCVTAGGNRSLPYHDAFPSISSKSFAMYIIAIKSGKDFDITTSLEACCARKHTSSGVTLQT